MRLFRRVWSLALLIAAVACGDDGGNDDGADTTGAATSASSEGDDRSDGDSSNGNVDDDSDEGAASSEGAGESSSNATNASSEGDASSDDEGATTDAESTGGPTSGPGVLPGESGLEAFCRRYVECGGSYYDGEQACIDASLGYWGECASRLAAQDAFGACMSEIECSDWTPDAYNPASTPCAEQWSDLGASEPCA